MANYELSNKAVEDLTNIWNYTYENWSEEQADKYYEMLLGNCQLIANNPNIGKIYSEIRNELFGLRANRHIIFYRKIKNKPIEITRILHERMDFKNRLKD